MSGANKTFTVPYSASIDSRPLTGRLVAMALVLALGSSLLHAGQNKINKHEDRNEIFQLEEVWRNAMLKGDTAAMAGLLADDYIAITAAGMLQTKDEAVNNLRTHRVHVTTLDVSERKVRFYGTTALVTSVASVQGTTPDGDVSGSFRYTRVYVRDAQDKWKIVSFEASRMRQPGEQRRKPTSVGQRSN
jgi:ketosteroid isomerase-like protein